MNEAETRWFLRLPFWISTSPPTCFVVVWGLLVLWAAQPDGKGFSTRASPGKDSNWLGLDPVPIPGPITVAPLESHAQPVERGRGLCQKKEEEGC